MTTAEKKIYKGISRGAGQGFLTGAAIVSLGNFTAKAIGAVARIPLTAYLGAEGMGLYQLAYPFYCLLLTLASAGLPSALSRIVAGEIKRGGSGEGTLETATRLFFFIGGLGTFAMIIFRGIISDLQGEDLRAAYVALSPAVICVALLSVFRGYFQGRCNMIPTAVSEVCEQVVKGGAALAAAYVFRHDVRRAVVYVLAAVSLSEVFALWYMYSRYRAQKTRTALYSAPCPGYGHILSLTLPVAAATAILPLSQFIDGGLATRILKTYTTDAVALYGLYAGGAVTLAGLPVSVCYGFAVSIIPRLGAGDEGKKTRNALLATIGISSVCAAGLYFFARQLGAIFFRRLSEERLDILEKLIKIISPTAITHSCAQTLSACLIGRGKAGRAAVNMGIAATLKTALVFFLLRMQNISVYGMAFAANVCYFTAFVLNLYSNIKINGHSGKKKES